MSLPEISSISNSNNVSNRNHSCKPVSGKLSSSESCHYLTAGNSYEMPQYELITHSDINVNSYLHALKDGFIGYNGILWQLKLREHPPRIQRARGSEYLFH